MKHTLFNLLFVSLVIINLNSIAATIRPACLYNIAALMRVLHSQQTEQPVNHYSDGNDGTTRGSSSIGTRIAPQN